METKQNITIFHYQTDYIIRYKKTYKKEKNNVFSTLLDYSICFVFDGEFKVTKENTMNSKKTIFVKKDDVIICKKDEKMTFEQVSECSEIILIDMMAIVFKNTIDEHDVFRIFNYCDVKSIYNINEFSSMFCLECFKSLKYCLETKKGRFHTLLRVKNIVSQLDFELDISLGENRFVEKNMIIKTIYYIKENYTKNLTLASVSDALGISKSSINRICRKMLGKSFLETLTQIRLETAVNALKNTEYNIKTVAILSGFNSYNSFYKAFVKVYGFPPSTNATKNKSIKWPFETGVFDFHNDID